MTEPSERVGATSRKLLINTAKVILTGVVVYFVARQVIVHWDEVEAFDWQVEYGQLALSILLSLVAFLLFADSWRRIIGGFGHQVGPLMAFKISYLSNLGRYIPGKVWQVFGMLYLAKKEGIPEEQAGASFVLWQLFTIPASLLVYVIAGQVEPAIMSDKVALIGEGGTYILGFAMLAACAVVVFWPEPLLKLANAVLQKLGRRPAKFLLDKTVALTAFLGYFLGWIVFGVAFWLFLRSILGDTAPSISASVGLYNLAYQIGYLTLFAPGGFGPRELVMGALLTPFIGPLAAVVAVIARLWSIVIEVLAAVLALLIRR